VKREGSSPRDDARKTRVVMVLLFRVIRVNPRPIFLLRFASVKNQGIIQGLRMAANFCLCGRRNF
jgi:hypothetical protein